MKLSDIVTETPMAPEPENQIDPNGRTSLSPSIKPADLVDDIAHFVRRRGHAEWPEIEAYLFHLHDLSAADMERTSGNTVLSRWKQTIRNVASGGSLVRKYPDIERVKNGFATTERRELDSGIRDTPGFVRGNQRYVA